MAIVRTNDQYYHDIADAIREKTGGTEDILPENMADELNAATLEPLTVTPTSEEQTFTPESPCIGFSVVTVEAAPDTGGGDIVEPETYPDAENVNFGTTSAGKDLYTGKYFYGKYSKAINLPDVSADCPYLAFFRDRNGNIWIMASSLELTHYSGSYHNICFEKAAKRQLWLYNSSTDTWTLNSESDGGSYGNIAVYVFYWSNQDILYNSYTNSSYAGDGSVKYAASEPVPETVDGGEIEYIETAETYTISGATLNALGAVTQQITGIEATTPSAMVSALQMYAGTH